MQDKLSLDVLKRYRQNVAKAIKGQLKMSDIGGSKCAYCEVYRSTFYCEPKCPIRRAGGNCSERDGHYQKLRSKLVLLNRASKKEVLAATWDMYDYLVKITNEQNLI